MSHKKVTIALILEIWLEFDSKSLKLDHDMNNSHFGSLSIRLLMLKQSASSLYIHHFSTVIDFSSKKYSGSTGHKNSWYQ